MRQPWIAQFPALEGLEPETRKAIEGAAQVVRLPAGEMVFRSGDECSNYLLVVEGRLRVQMVAESGREIVLYRVDAGQTCVLTTACLLAHDAYSAEGITETEVTAVAIPGTVFHNWLARSATLRDFVFSTYGRRIANLMVLVKEVAFRRIDIRLARFLSDHQSAGGTLVLTHQDLAVELGTAREVISRQLKEFEHKGWVRLGRGHIQLANAVALASLADSD